jgi:hypothetical protein
MSEYQSASTLQNSVYSWTIAKSGRFGKLYKQPSTQSIYDLPDSKGSRTTTFGYGERNLFNIKSCSPPPDKYNLPNIFEENISKRKGTKLLYKINPLVKIFNIDYREFELPISR